MYSRKLCIALLLACAIAYVSGVLPGSVACAKKDECPVMLGRTFVEGDSLQYQLKIGSQSGVKRTAYEQTVNGQTEFKITNWIIRVADENVAVRTRFDHAAGSMSYGDSFKPVAAVAELRGKEMEIILDPYGDLVSWSGLGSEEYLEMGTGQLAMLMKAFFPILPDTLVSPGYSWVEEYSIPSISTRAQQDYIGETTYTFKGVKSKKGVDCAEIESKGTIIYEGRAEQAGEVWLMSGEGEVKGKLYVSLDGGMVVESKSDVKMTLEGEGQSIAGAAAGDMVEMGIKSKLEVKML